MRILKPICDSCEAYEAYVIESTGIDCSLLDTEAYVIPEAGYFVSRLQESLLYSTLEPFMLNFWDFELNVTLNGCIQDTM